MTYDRNNFLNYTVTFLERSGFSENVGSQLLIQTGPTEEMKDTPHIETSVPQKFVAPLNLNSKPTKSFCK